MRMVQPSQALFCGGAFVSLASASGQSTRSRKVLSKSFLRHRKSKRSLGSNKTGDACKSGDACKTGDARAGVVKVVDAGDSKSQNDDSEGD